MQAPLNLVEFSNTTIVHKLLDAELCSKFEMGKRWYHKLSMQERVTVVL